MEEGPIGADGSGGGHFRWAEEDVQLGGVTKDGQHVAQWRDRGRRSGRCRIGSCTLVISCGRVVIGVIGFDFDDKEKKEEKKEEKGVNGES